MAEEMSGGSSETGGLHAYERGTVDRFFAEAWHERVRLLTEIAGARRRIAQGKAALAASADTADAGIRAVLDAQRAHREEQRANARAIAAVHADAEAQAERILRDTQSRARAIEVSRQVGEIRQPPLRAEAPS